jgi:hypothetical protein
MSVIALFLATTLAVPAEAAESATPALATVHFADGSQVSLTGWLFSYEFLSGKAGGLPSNSLRRDAPELRIGGKSWPPRGLKIEIEYQTIEREHEGENGEMIKEKVARASNLSITHAGKTTKVRPQAPDRKFLIGDEKSLNVLPRTLDLRGETLTGTKREVCLVAYSELADCGAGDENRVVKVDLQ